MRFHDLNQEEIWLDAAGTEVRIADLDQGYAGNILNFLRLRARNIASQYTAYLALMPLPLSDAAYDAVMADIEQELDAIHGDPLAWLNAKPQVKAVQARFDELATARRETAGYL